MVDLEYDKGLEHNAHNDVRVVKLHNFIRRKKPRPEFCEICNKQAPRDLSNISPKYNPETYNEDLNNWKWVCRSCHMIEDGRLQSMRQKGIEASKIRNDEQTQEIKNMLQPMNLNNPHRFYEKDELKDFNMILNDTDPIKIFICNFCGQWNKVHESQLKTREQLAKERRKKRVIHMEVDEDIAIGWNKFKANFGTHERAVAVALSEFYKHNR